jgi:hypothetical protein
MASMAEAPATRRRWFQFGMGTMFAVVTALAIYAGIVAYVRPKHPVVAMIVPIAAAVILGGLSFAPQRYGRWLRPVAILAIGAGAFVLGIWLNSANR